jgi:hypothetical protein
VGKKHVAVVCGVAGTAVDRQQNTFAKNVSRHHRQLAVPADLWARATSVGGNTSTLD